MATKVASIEYLVREILLRLPVKSLIRFKCVSKQWLALISEPKFCHLHTLRLYKNGRVIPSALLLASKDAQICPIIPLKTTNVCGSSENFHNVEIPKGTVIQSSNGLLLIRRRKKKCFEGCDYFICNPTTNEFVPVIFPIQLLDSSHFIWFEPLKSPYYKLVSIAPDFGDFLSSDTLLENKYIFSVYSSESMSWCESRFAFDLPYDECPYLNCAVFVNSTLYFYTSGIKSVCCFDFETLSFKKCSMPLQNFYVLYFGFSGGNLIILLRSLLSQVYGLKLNVENFKFSLIFKWNQLKASVVEMSCLYSAVEQGNNKDIIIVSYSNSNGRVISHNLTNSSDKVLFSFSSDQIPVEVSQIFPHYENLSCVGPCVGTFDP